MKQMNNVTCFGRLRTTLRVGWLYPDLMSTYGDRGNIIILQKRCQWRGIGIDIKSIDFSTRNSELATVDLFFGGGAQDRQQGILIDDLREKKGPVLKKMIDAGTPGLFVCGSPQLLGHSFIGGDGKELKGLGIFDMVSRYPGKGTKRCIGNMIAKIEPSAFSHPTDAKPSCRHGRAMVGKQFADRNTVVGFENHGGRTYLGKGVKPFARVIRGFGNNGGDGTEGALYKNCIATYMHGPFLSKNPHVADWLIEKALEVKYGKEIIIDSLDDTLEWQAHEYMLKRLEL